MDGLDRRTALGQLHVVGWRPEILESAAELALLAASGGLLAASGGLLAASGDPRAASDSPRGATELQRGIARIRLADEDAVMKCSPFHGKSAIRWGLKRALFHARLPRVNEFYNLAWLTRRLFATPQPLAAGGIVLRGLPRWQFLVTRFVPDAVPLHEWLLGAPSAAERSAVLDEIAREVARMHDLRFVHRDLWTRNLLVVPPGGLARVLFFDAWAGGPGPGWRGAAHDLRCFEHDMQHLWTADEEATWRERYAAERSALH